MPKPKTPKTPQQPKSLFHQQQRLLLDAFSRKGNLRDSTLILLVLKTGLHARFQKWRKADVFQRMWLEVLLSYDEMKALVWHGKRMSRK